MTHPRPQVLLVTFASQGHINPSLQFAKTLINNGVHVTFMTASSTMHQMAKTPAPQGLSYAYFSDGNESVFQLTGDINRYLSETKSHGTQSLREFLADQGTLFTSIVYCTLLPWVATVAREFNIPSTLLWFQPASLLNIFYHYFKGYEEMITKNIDDPTFSVKMPGLPPLSRRDLPSFFIPPTPHVVPLQTFKEHVQVLDQQTKPRVLVNTFDLLEPQAIKAAENCYNLIGVGPLMPSAFEASKERREMEWLSTKPERSVIYVSFGSLSTLAKAQMEELAKGLLEAGRPFLWVIRESGGEEKEGLSSQRELEKQGMIVPWCSQVEVLSHPSVGCFLTHCGWNSTFESLVSGVPMVTFPQWVDQGTNSKLVRDVWNTGVRLTENGVGIVEGYEIKRCLEMVMGSEEIRKNAMKWKDLAKEAVQKGGSSYKNIQAFVEELTNDPS
ncbi:Crocetin glucosyltransferase [Hibiscus syriacus]|uniref:Glycosyltransferase n=1 Tax=Hibiscus syriacus TaxID=106335 RepID=A0A6A3AU52_HIBSY|nr:crocetin glucosyltransferase, chloroplastic-like [Hibiscus syriacus]KAE8706927.1 Crocetin glucosyltransferase [Hibiscus syriacus]